MKLTKFALIVLITLTIGIMNTKAEDKPIFKSTVDSVSYVLGMQLAQFMGTDIKDLNYDLLKRGANDFGTGKDLLTGTDIQKLITNYQEAKTKLAGKANTEKGAKFLAENKTKPGIKVTPSGLQYQVIKEGTGPHPLATETVKVHYEGKLIDGTVFDSSIKRGEPIEFPLNRVIPGWTEGVQLMTVGAKYLFFIPSELAYGERGAAPQIGPNEVLVFEVELLGITPPAPTPDEQATPAVETPAKESTPAPEKAKPKKTK
ncbi:MAG: FKBP-type peptidyl-prolyl cis-trans isomerase [bacterium]